MRGSSASPGEKFAHNRTEFGFSPAHLRFQHHCSGSAEKFPPTLPCFFESLRTKCIDLKPAIRQSKRRVSDRLPSLFRNRSSAVIFKETDRNLFNRRFVNLVHRNRRRRRIAVVPSRHHFKKQPHIFYSARHRSDHAEQCK